MLAISGIAHARDRTSLDEAIAAIRSRDLGAMHQMEAESYLRAWYSREGQSFLAKAPEFLTLIRDVRARVLELRQKYVPQVRLRSSGSTVNGRAKALQ